MPSSPRALAGRLRTFARVGLGLALALPLKWVAPIYRVEVQRIYAERIGHLALEPELLLSKREGCPPFRGRTVYYLEPPVSNEQVAQMWRRSLVFGPRWLLAPIYSAHLRFPWLDVGARGWDEKHADLRPLDGCAPHLRFSSGDEVRGDEVLRRLGVPHGTPFVCLAVRDGAYLGSAWPDRNWDYHNHRDSKIDTYVEMAEWLASEGYAVLRMGRVVEAPLRSEHPLVIDYATSDLRSDLADVFLFANCDFCISTSTGMDSLALVFRRPVGVVNLPGVGGLRLGRTTVLAMLKDVHDLDSRQRLRLRDPRRMQSMLFHRASDFDEAGLALVDNSDEDLVAFAKEMVAITRGSWHPYVGQSEVESQLKAALPGETDRSPASFRLSRGWLLERW